MNRRLASRATAALVLALSFAQALAQQSEARLAGTPRGKIIDNDERRELARRLGESAPVDINFNNPARVPVRVKEAKVKGVRRDEQRWTKNGEAVLSDYAMSARLTFENTTTKNAKQVCLRFMDAEGKSIFYVSYDVERRKNPLVFIQFMIVTGDPSRFVIELAAARFENESVWGDIISPQKKDLTITQNRSKEFYKARLEEAKLQAAERTKVDARPKLLIRPLGPTYTEQARRNRVQGTVRLRLHIGTDSAVKQVRVTNALPDGLTEEAIRIAYKMKFEPAKKGGVAVEFWDVAQIDFNIK
jgi:TonB family protein